MAKLPIGKASQVQLDGSWRAIPEIQALADANAGALWREISSGLLDTVNAVTSQAPTYFPYAAEVVAIRVRVRTAGGTASAHVLVGILGDTDYYCDVTVATTDAAGTEFTATLLHTAIAAGTVLTFNSDGGASTTGDVDVWVLTRSV